VRLIPSRAWADAFCGSRTTLWQRIAGILSPVILLGTILFIVLRWRTLPEQIPTHYNMAGEIDGYGSRWTLLVLPVIGLVTDLVVAISSRFPQSWNAGVKITVYNRVRIYRIMRDLLSEVRLGCAILFAFLSVWLSLTPGNMPVWVLLTVPLVLVFVPLIRYFIRVIRAK
jgi:uncharacterized membrane protein